MEKEQLLPVEQVSTKEPSRWTRRAAPALLGAGLLLGACTSNGEEERRDLQVAEAEHEEACNVAGFDIGEYADQIGTGPYAPNEAFHAEERREDDVRAELMDELPQNTMGIALINEFRKQQSGEYAISDVLGRVGESFSQMQQSDTQRQENCATVLEAIAAEGEVTEITAPRLLEVRNKYEDGELVGLDYEIVQSQDKINVVTIRDENNAIRWGKVLSEERNGQFVIVLHEGDIQGEQEDGEQEELAVDEEQEQVAPEEQQEQAADEAETQQPSGQQPAETQQPSGQDRADQRTGDGGAGTERDTDGADGGKGPGGDADKETDDGRGGEKGGDGPGCEGVGEGCPGEGPGGDDKDKKEDDKAKEEDKPKLDKPKEEEPKEPKPEPEPEPEKPKPEPEPEPEKPEEPEEPKEDDKKGEAPDDNPFTS